MTHSHLTFEQLVALRYGRLSPGDLVARGLRHLRETCPECEGAFQRLDEYRREKRRTDPTRYASTFTRLTEKAPEMEAAVEADLRAAQVDLEALLGLTDQQQRIGRIRSTPRRMNTIALIDLLLDEAGRTVGKKPRHALRWLECAAAVVARLPTDTVDRPRRMWLSLRVEAHRANALRVLGDLLAAESLWRSLNDQLELSPAGSPDEDAEFLSLEASLRTDLRQFDEALRLLARAERIYRLIDDRPGLVKILIQQANATDEAGDASGSLTLFRQAAELLDPGTDPNLARMVQHNLADALINLGQVEEAEEALGRSLELAGPEADHLHTGWVRGKIAHARGRLEEAARAFQATVNECLRRELHYDAALAHLDLAEVLLAQGNSSEVKRLAKAMEPAFRSRGVHREAAAAMLLYLDAAVAESLNLRLLEELRTFLRLARNDRDAVFRPDRGGAPDRTA